MNKYFNREFSWLEFNKRVLEIFDRDRLSMGEKAKFISIFCSNLDEFYMVRVGSLWDQSRNPETEPDISGLLPGAQLERIAKRAKELSGECYSRFGRLKADFAEKQIFLQGMEDLAALEQQYLESFFKSHIYPQLTFRLIDEEREFPLIKNKTLNLFVRLKKEGKLCWGNVQIPENENRLIEISGRKERKFILLEDLIAGNLNFLFDGYLIEESCCYRITRNADLNYDEDESKDLLSKIEKSIRKRNWGQVVRLEFQGNPSEELVAMLSDKFRITGREVFLIPGPLDLTFLNQILKKKWFAAHLLPPFKGKDPFRGVVRRNLFKQIREKDRLCHLPYDDFSCILDFLQLAASDPKVAAIKQTLYRVSNKSPIIDALVEGAKAGKNVTVLLEVKARFDEENNIAWAKKLEKAGVQVILSPLELKTHSKLLLVVRREKDAPGGLRSYCHLSTGNYNEKTAATYEDLGIFTAEQEVGEDIIKIFNFLATGREIDSTNRLIASPFQTREYITRLIEDEAREALAGKPAAIRMKMNSLIDKEIIDKLYEAGQSGVRIDLIVRGICGLVPTRNIRVRSIVGRFLEHSRIYSFHHGGEQLTFISSMDMMERNFDRRVETLNPVLDPEVKERVQGILDRLFQDTENSYELATNGEYHKVKKERKFNAHSYFLNGEK